MHPAYAAGTVAVPPAPAPVTPSATQYLPTDAGLTCAQQLTSYINGTTDSALAAQVAGLGVAAVGALAEAIIVDIPVAAVVEAGGLTATAVGVGLSIAAQVGTQTASGLPSCDQRFVGTVTVDAGGANITGNSIFQNSLGVVGDLNVGGNFAATTITSPNPATLGGVTVGNAAGTQRGIELGGGSLSGAGSGAGALAGAINAIAIGNGAVALTATSTAIGTTASATGTNSTAVGSAALATAADTTAVGANAGATAPGASAYGSGATASGALSTALGQNALAAAGGSAVGAGAVALGLNATAVGQGALGIGSMSTAVGQASIAAGALSTALGQNAAAVTGGSAVGSGAAAVALNATAVGQGALGAGEASTAIGQASSATGNLSTATGANALAGGFAASTYGQGAIAAFDNSTAIGSDSRTTANGSVALGQGSIAGAANGGWAGFIINNQPVTNNATASSVVSVGGGAGSATPYRQVTNVADGAVNPASTDATNGSQLYKAVTGLNTEILNTRREAREGIAGALALTAAPMPSRGGKTTYAANFGFFKDAGAFGGSFAHRFDTNMPIALAGGIAVSGQGTLGGRFGLLGEF